MSTKNGDKVATQRIEAIETAIEIEVTVTVTVDDDDKVIVTLPRRAAIMLYHLVGMMGGGEESLDGLYHGLGRYFGPDANGADDYRKFWSDQAAANGFHEPFVNHCGVTVFDAPGTHGPHNEPHFPCSKRGAAR